MTEPNPLAVIDRAIDRQGQIGVDLSKKEKRTGTTRQQQAVLSPPAQARLLGQRHLHHRRRIDEHPVNVGHDPIDPIGKLLQTGTQHLVVIAAKCITGNIGFHGITEHLQRARGVRQIGHAC